MEKSNKASQPKTNTPEVLQAQKDVSQEQLSKPTTPQTTDKKWLASVLVGLLIVFLGIAGYFAYQNVQLRNSLPTNIEPTTTQATEVILHEATPIETVEEDSNLHLNLSTKSSTEIESHLSDLCETEIYDSNAIKKENFTKFNFDESLNMANDYLNGNRFFKDKNLVAEVTKMQDKYQLKDGFGGNLFYGFSIKPSNEKNNIKNGRIFLNAFTSLPYLVDITYNDEINEGGVYKRYISQERIIPINSAQNKAQDFLLTNNININDGTYTLKKSDNDLGAYSFIWEKWIEGVLIGTISVDIHFDGLFKKFTDYRVANVPSLKPIIGLQEAQEIAKKCLPVTLDKENDIEMSNSDLILVSIPKDIPWAQKKLAWKFTFKVKSEKKSSDMNMCSINIYINSTNSKAITPYDYSPCYIR